MEELNMLISQLEDAVQGFTTAGAPAADQESAYFWDDHRDDLFWEPTLRHAKGRWQVEGIAGLVSGLRSVARAQKSIVGGASIEHVRADLEINAPPILTYYLWNMHPLFLNGVLSGELTRNLYATEGHQLRSIVSQYHSLDNYPGIYLNVYCRKQYPAGGSAQINPSRWAGFGLTPREYEHICDKICLYLGDTVESIEYAREIDCVHNPTKDGDRPSTLSNPNGIDYSIGQRRYTRSLRGPEIIMQWVKGIEDHIIRLKNITGLEHTPIARCITEVGWGRQCQKRASQHLIHEGTNSLYGVVTAIADFEYPREFGTEQFQMARLKDGKDVAPMEVYCSMIASSYWFNGGANPYPAGGMSQSGKASVQARGLDNAYTRNADFNQRNGPFQSSLETDKEKRDRLGALYEMWENITKIRAEISGLEKEGEWELKRMRNAQANLCLEEKLAPLRRKYQTLRESMQSAGIKLPWLPLSLLSGELGDDLLPEKEGGSSVRPASQENEEIEVPDSDE